MQFYQSIGQWYDLIFPYKEVQKQFVHSNLNTKNATILDVGCATGKLALQLAREGATVTGIDSDRFMITQAEQEAAKDQLNAEFITGDMLDTNKLFTDNSLDGVICFGNTVVHLKDLNQVKSFFEQCYYVLKPGAKLMVQLINYNRILEQKVDHLPTIETNELSFKRLYHSDVSETHIRFHTYLTIKKNNQVIENNIPLLAIQKQDLEKVLKELKFKNIEFFGNFKKDKWSIDSVPCVFVAEK